MMVHQSIKPSIKHQHQNINSLEVLTSDSGIPREQLVQVNDDGSEYTEECTETQHDEVSHREGQGRGASKVGIGTLILGILGPRRRADIDALNGGGTVSWE